MTDIETIREALELAQRLDGMEQARFAARWSDAKVALDRVATMNDGLKEDLDFLNTRNHELLDKIDRLAARVGELEWQPIETAPGDRPILLHDDDQTNVPIVGRWDDGDRRRDMLAPGPGWFVSSQYGGLLFTESGHEQIHNPTRWRTLPPPPETNDE